MKTPKHLPFCSDCKRRAALRNSDLCRACWQAWWIALHTVSGQDQGETVDRLESE